MIYWIATSPYPEEVDDNYKNEQGEGKGEGRVGEKGRRRRSKKEYFCWNEYILEKWTLSNEPTILLIGSFGNIYIGSLFL